MKKIPLSQGKFAIVDDSDYEELSRYKWSASLHMGKFYAVRHGPRPERIRIRMHREILQPSIGKWCDHKNGDTLDNRCSNLRECTNSQNQMNSKKRKGSSIFKGVSRYKLGKWQVHIRENGRQKNIGIFNNEQEAARTYNKWAIKLFGEFALLNQLDSEVVS